MTAAGFQNRPRRACCVEVEQVIVRKLLAAENPPSERAASSLRAASPLRPIFTLQKNENGLLMGIFTIAKATLDAPGETEFDAGGSCMGGTRCSGGQELGARSGS